MKNHEHTISKFIYSSLPISPFIPHFPPPPLITSPPSAHSINPNPLKPLQYPISVSPRPCPAVPRRYKHLKKTHQYKHPSQSPSLPNTYPHHNPTPRIKTFNQPSHPNKTIQNLKPPFSSQKHPPTATRPKKKKEKKSSFVRHAMPFFFQNAYPTASIRSTASAPDGRLTAMYPKLSPPVYIPHHQTPPPPKKRKD